MHRDATAWGRMAGQPRPRPNGCKSMGKWERVRPKSCQEQRDGCQGELYAVAVWESLREEVEGPEPLKTTRGRWQDDDQGPPREGAWRLAPKRLVCTGACRPIDGGLAQPSDRVRWDGAFGSDLEGVAVVVEAAARFRTVLGSATHHHGSSNTAFAGLPARFAVSTACFFSSLQEAVGQLVRSGRERGRWEWTRWSSSWRRPEEAGERQTQSN